MSSWLQINIDRKETLSKSEVPTHKIIQSSCDLKWSFSSSFPFTDKLSDLMRNILFLRVINKGGVKRDRCGFDVTFMTYERLVIKAMESQYYLIQSVFETKVGINRTDVKKTQSKKQNKVYHFWCSWTLYRSKYHFVLRYILNYIHCSCTFEILTTSITRNGTNLILA